MRLAIILFFVLASSFAQETEPLDSLNQELADKEKTAFAFRLKQFERKLDDRYAFNVNNELKQNLGDFKEFFYKTFDRGEYIYNSAFNEKIQEIYTEIYTNNPNVPKDFQVLVSRNISLNAYCFINGTMVVHVGAIHYLENEDQLAGILCHEISHKLLNHSENDLVQSAKEKYAKETRKTNRALKRQKYNQQKTAFSTLKEKLLNHGKTNRAQEYQADSLGFALLKNTKYRPSEFIRALELSWKYDTIKPTDLTTEIYKQVFDLPNLPFDEGWLNKEDFSGYEYNFEEKISKDSLKSHPEIAKRIERIKSIFPEINEYEQDTQTSKVDEDYLELRKRARKMQAPNLYDLKKYGFCIYLSLMRIQQGYLVEHHKNWLGQAFKEMHKARKEYKANKYLDRINPEEQSESYQQFINFMWNLRLEEIEKIADHYSQS